MVVSAYKSVLLWNVVIYVTSTFHKETLHYCCSSGSTIIHHWLFNRVMQCRRKDEPVCN